MWAPATAAALTLSLLFRTIGPNEDKDELEEILREDMATYELRFPKIDRTKMTDWDQARDELTYDPQAAWEDEVMYCAQHGLPRPADIPRHGFDPYMTEEQLEAASVKAVAYNLAKEEAALNAGDPAVSLRNDGQSNWSGNTNEHADHTSELGPDIPYDQARHGSENYPKNITLPLPKKGWWAGAWRFPSFETRLGNLYKEMWPQRAEPWQDHHPGGCKTHSIGPILPASMEDTWDYGRQCDEEGTLAPEPSPGLKLDPMPMPETKDINAGRDMSKLNQLFFQIRSTEVHRRMTLATLSPVLFRRNDYPFPYVVDENVRFAGCTVHIMVTGEYGVVLISAADERDIREQVTELARAGEVVRLLAPEGMSVLPIIVYSTDALSNRDPWVHRTEEGFTCCVMGVHQVMRAVYQTVRNPEVGGLSQEELYRSQQGRSLSEIYLWMQEEDIASVRKRVDKLHPDGLPDAPAGVNDEPSVSTDKDAPGVTGDRIRNAVEKAEGGPVDPRRNTYN